MPQPVTAADPDLSSYGRGTLPAGIRSRSLAGINGLCVHVLEAGFEPGGGPALLLLHGFPELAYSWRKVMLPLAAAGYHVIAPDQRGFGRTTGWDAAYDADPSPFRMLNMVRDAIGVLRALGHERAAAVIGHDSGSYVAGWCALVRPDLFGAVAMMSAPFAGPPAFGALVPARLPSADLDAALAGLERPREYYQEWFTGRDANADKMNAPQGLRAFIRAYYHFKSADFAGNMPARLAAASADELAKMPAYYVMDRDRGMAATVAEHMPSSAEVAACRWMSEAELDVYAQEYGRTGFQGGLQAYRRVKDPVDLAQSQVFTGRTIDIPSCFIAGNADWGIYQTPGALERMRDELCTDTRGVHVIDGAGHWVQQEQPAEVVRHLLALVGR